MPIFPRAHFHHGDNVIGAIPIPSDPAAVLTTLVVEDDEAVRSTLSRFLQSLGHEVLLAGTGAEALDHLVRRKLTCVLLDIRLPEGSGLDLIPEVLEREPNAAILMLTAVNDASMATTSLQRGAADYLVKPIDLPQLKQSIAKALAWRDRMIDQEETQAWLKQELVSRGAELRRERGNLERISVATLEALVNALEAKDAYLRGHSARIADLAASIAAEMKMTDEQVEAVRTAGRLHDIGKIGIREAVLNKRGSLTDEEYEHVKTHVQIGVQILAPLTHLGEIISYVNAHHERMDGTGYPNGMEGAAIPIGARILGATEVYDALTTSRPYQERMSPMDAVTRMRDLVDTVLDGRVLEALEAVVTSREKLVFLEGTER